MIRVDSVPWPDNKGCAALGAGQVEEEASADSCGEALQRLCAPSARGATSCSVCCGQQQHQLREAQCSAAMCDAFCSRPSSAGCGAVPLSCSPHCGAAIKTAMDSCSASGGGEVTLLAGIYHINDTTPSIVLSGLQDVSLRGSPGTSGFTTTGPDPTASTLMFHGRRMGFQVSGSQNVSFFGFQIDMSRQPYTYGQAVAVEADSFTIEFDESAYPFPTGAAWSWLLKVQAVMGFDTTAWREASGAVDIYATSDPLSCAVTAPGRLTVQLPSSQAGAVPIRVGDSYILRHQVYSLNGFSFSDTLSPTLEKVVIWSIPGMGFYFGRTRDITITSCGVRARPGRPMSITADASHFSETSGFVHLNGVHFELQGDDGEHDRLQTTLLAGLCFSHRFSLCFRAEYPWRVPREIVILSRFACCPSH